MAINQVTGKDLYCLQKQIIDSFPEPKNDYDRTDFNLQGVRTFSSYNAVSFVYTLAAAMAIPALLVLYSFNRLLWRHRKKNLGKTIVIESHNRSGKAYDFDGRIPSLSEKYQPVIEYKTGAFPGIKEGIIGIKALKLFIGFSLRHPFQCFTNLRCLINVMGYNKILYLHAPSAIVASRMELNPMSSLITNLCEANGCEFICFMHGEVMTNIATAFVRFSRFYVWDEHYIDVFSWGRCNKDQFVVYKPGIYSYNPTSLEQPEFFLTYYLTGDERIGVDLHIEEISRCLIQISKLGKKCKVRPHPRWSDMNTIVPLFKNTGIVVEHCNQISVEESISNSENVAGTFSSVLTQAYYYGKQVYIDDISDPQLIDELAERKYFLLSKRDVGHLSHLINELSNESK